MNLPRLAGRARVACVLLTVNFSAVSVALRAQATPDAAPDAATLAKYDHNHNGVLDPDEIAEMQAEKNGKPAPDVVKLTPFEVDATKDNGYYAANTLSGTRINSKVQNLGASITVVTKQQLTDTAALDINDVFKYEANVEGIFDYTAITPSSPTTDTIQGGTATSGGPNVATRVRGITTPNIAEDNFIHTARLGFDTYNVGSIEISRGPNSTLFGLGNPSGTINTNLITANPNHATNEIAFRVDSYGGYRSNFGFNRPILKDKLAIYVAGLYQDAEVPQKPSYDLEKREYAALFYQPFAGTVINLKAEHYRENRQAPNSLTPRDAVTEWINNGKPTWNPVTFTATVNGVNTAPIPVGSGTTAENVVLPLGLFANATMYTRPTMFIDGGQVQLWEENRLNTLVGSPVNPAAATSSNVRMLESGTQIIRAQVNGGNLYNAVGISNRALYDWTSINAAPVNWNYDAAALYTAELQQKIVENLYFRVAWHLEDSVEYNRNVASPTLFVDVNKTLVDGRPNPYYLRPYFQAIEPSIYRLPEFNDNEQAQLTYEFNMGDKPGILKWLGHHRMVGYYEGRHITDGTFRFREAVLDPNQPWETPGALNFTNGSAEGRPTYNYYVGPTNATGYTKGYNAPKSGVGGIYNLNYVDPATGNLISDPAQFGTATYVSSQTRQEVVSRGGVLQSDFFNERIVFTGGLRKDFNRSRNSNGNVINAATGYYDNGPLKTWLPWTDATGLTRTVGVVVKPLPWFGLSYNKASSFLPQPLAVDLSGNVLPNTYGHGHDSGGFINLFGEKLVLSIKIYRQDNTNDRTTNTTLGSRVARIEAGGPNGPLTGNSADTFSLYNFAQTVAAARLGPTATQDQLNAVIASITQYPAGFQNALASGAAIRGTANTEAKGAELEMTYNPTSNWNIKFAGAQTETLNTSIEGNFADYLAARLPYWLSVKDDAGNPWWTSTALGTSAGSAQNFYTANVSAPLKLDQALLGKANPQVKKYTWRLISNYYLTRGWLNGTSFGGALRWDDRSVIGYLGAAPDPDGIVRSLDATKGVYDPARYGADVWLAYKMKMWSNRVGTRFALNVQNVQESGRLQTVGVNPDGTPFNFRIINPRKFVFSTTFDF